MKKTMEFSENKAAGADSREHEFLFGTSFVPYAKAADMPMSEWEKDIISMKKLGFKVFRPFTAWDRIEVEEGEYDFSKLDYDFELAEKHGLGIFLNAGGLFNNSCGAYPPRWLLRNYNCQHIVSDPQAVTVPFGPRRYLCMDDPIYVEKSESFLKKVIERYSSCDALLAWVIWNEPYISKNGCFCSCTTERFIQWLKEKYHGDLDELNKIWGSEFPVNYISWDEVQPPLGAGFLFGGYVPKLDWMRFNEDNLCGHIRRIHEMVKRLDPRKRPTTGNMVWTAPSDGYSGHSCIDIWKMGQSMDVLGYSHYTLFNEPAYLKASRLDKVRCASRDPDKKFFVLETEGGPLGWCGNEDVPGGIIHSWDGPRRESTYYQAVLHGTKAILPFKFRGRVSDNQTDEYNIMAWDGEITERALLNAGVSNSLQKIAPSVNRTKYTAEVAVYSSGESMKFTSVAVIKEAWKDAIEGAYKIFWDANIPVDYVGERELLNDGLHKYKMLLIPFGINISRDGAKAIAAYVSQGGYVIADFYFGGKDEDGNMNLRAPGFGLDKVFGGYFNDVLQLHPEKDECVVMGGGFPKFKAYHAIHSMHSYDGATVLGSFGSGAPAVIENRYGKGRTLLFGTMLFSSYKHGIDNRVGDMILRAAESVGIRSEFGVSGSKGEADSLKNVEIGTMDKGSVYFLINHNEKPVSFELAFKNDVGTAEFQELRSGKRIRMESGRLPLAMEPFETFILTASSPRLKNSNKPSNDSRE